MLTINPHDCAGGTSCSIPNAQCSAGTSGGQQCTVRSDRDSFHAVAVTGEDSALLPGGRIPDPNRRVTTADKPRTVRGNRDRSYCACVAGEDSALLPGGRIPDPSRLIPAGGDNPRAIRSDRLLRH